MGVVGGERAVADRRGAARSVRQPTCRTPGEVAVEDHVAHVQRSCVVDASTAAALGAVVQHPCVVERQHSGQVGDPSSVTHAAPHGDIALDDAAVEQRDVAAEIRDRSTVDLRAVGSQADVEERQFGVPVPDAATVSVITGEVIHETVVDRHVGEDHLARARDVEESVADRCVEDDRLVELADDHDVVGDVQVARRCCVLVGPSEQQVEPWCNPGGPRESRQENRLIGRERVRLLNRSAERARGAAGRRCRSCRLPTIGIDSVGCRVDDERDAGGRVGCAGEEAKRASGHRRARPTDVRLRAACLDRVPPLLPVDQRL